MAKKHTVKFVAKKKVSVPVKVDFETKKGEVAFSAHKTVEKRVPVKFKARNKTS